MNTNFTNDLLQRTSDNITKLADDLKQQNDPYISLSDDKTALLEDLQIITYANILSVASWKLIDPIYNIDTSECVKGTNYYRKALTLLKSANSVLNK